MVSASDNVLIMIFSRSATSVIYLVCASDDVLPYHVAGNL